MMRLTALHEIDLRAIDYSDLKIDYSDLSTSINLCNLLFNLCNQGLHEFCEALEVRRRGVTYDQD